MVVSAKAEKGSYTSDSGRVLSMSHGNLKKQKQMMAAESLRNPNLRMNLCGDRGKAVTLHGLSQSLLLHTAKSTPR
jgi:hypothetical protein